MAEKDNIGCLFSSEEMTRTMGGLDFKEDQPVTVLGITFENDAKRREYFREELRKKLPELRHIEGFPIGSDDDIINLSDPPYYTACPNPWLNDFIQQWEEEKKQLEAEGKRQPNVVVNKPYAYGIKVGKNSSIYNAHTYHTKVPHEVIMRYILHYTQPGDIVLDGFSGSGMTGVAASQCNFPDKETKNTIETDFSQNQIQAPKWGERHAVCGDLSSICYHIASNYNSEVETTELHNIIDSLLEDIKSRFDNFYEVNTAYGLSHVNYFVWSQVVSCRNCGCELNVHNLTFDYKRSILHESLVCPNCGTEQKRTEADSIWDTSFDSILNKSINELKYDCCLMNVSTHKNGRQFINKIQEPVYPDFVGYIPTTELIEGDKFSDPLRVGANHINLLYSKRTRYVISYIYYLIHTKYVKHEKALMFIFTSMLPKLTRMNRYMPQHGSRALVGPMANTLYIPPQYVENNPIDQFEYQAKKVLKAFELTKGGSVIQITSATNSSLPDNSVDYIFTDPPFGANIMYSELNIVSESWLRVFTNNEEEAISNKTQNKGFDEYQDIMTQCFKEYFRVLKPNKWMTVEFSNTSASFWNSLQNSIRSAGFIIMTVTDLNKQRGGLHSMLGPTAVKQDLAISCFKPEAELIAEMTAQDSLSGLWDLTNTLLMKLPIHIEQGNKTTSVIERSAKILYDRVISYYVQNNLSVPISSVDYQRGLSERYVERDGMFFTASQAAEYDELRKHTEGFQTNLFIVDSEQGGIAWLKNELYTPQTYQELYPKWIKATNAWRKGDIEPELKQLLEENFIKESDGKWRRPNLQDDVDLEALRTKSLLREFKIYVEIAQKPKAKIKEVRMEALRAGFKQCYIDKDFQTIVTVGDKIPQNLLTEDEVLLQFYDIAQNKL